MELKNATMYHFWDRRIISSNWSKGATFTIDKDYKTYECKDITPIDLNLPTVEKIIEYQKMLKNNDLLLTNNDKLVIREKMLELYRAKYLPNEISRMHCMYFCDENSLMYWRRMFPSYFDLYEVKLNGVAFKSSAKLLPHISNCNKHTFKEMEELCRAYWNPNLMDENLCCFAEYLFQGEVYVKKKTNVNNVRSRYIYH